MLPNSFFNRDAQEVAIDLLGKVLYRFYKGIWLSTMIIETEAYYLAEKGSHSSLGFTEKRKALFMSPGTIYMYYSRGGDSMNVSAKGEGNAVLLKSGFPFVNKNTHPQMIETMKTLNPKKDLLVREVEYLCSGQTLLCKSLNIKVGEWNQKQFNMSKLYIADIGYKPKKYIQTTRLGIREDRDSHLMYRFIDYNYARYSTKDVLRQKKKVHGKDYLILSS